MVILISYCFGKEAMLGTHTFHLFMLQEEEVKLSKLSKATGIPECVLGGWSTGSAKFPMDISTMHLSSTLRAGTHS